MPPPPAAEESFAQLVPLELDEELDEQPAASSAAAATPASANRYEDLTSASLKLSCPEVDYGCPKRPQAAVPKWFADRPIPQLRVQDKRT
jgi:hypothetical protein